VTAPIPRTVAGGSVTITVPLSNSGTVLSTNGNLYLSSLVTNSGTLVADGGFIEVQGGTLGGTIEALSNNVGLIGTYAVAADTIDTVTFGNANLGWYGDGYAVFAGPGTLVSNGNVAVSAYDYASVQLQLIDGITWDNAGTVNQYGGLVFGGTTEGNFYALDAMTGKPVWDFQTGGYISANPISFSIDGKQCVAIASGHSILVFGL